MPRRRVECDRNRQQRKRLRRYWQDMPSRAPRQDLNRSGQPSATGEGEKLRNQRARADRTISLEDSVSDLISGVLTVRQRLLPNAS